MLKKINATQFQNVITKTDFFGNEFVEEVGRPWTLEEKQIDIDSLVSRKNTLNTKLIQARAEKQEAIALNNIIK